MNWIAQVMSKDSFKFIPDLYEQLSEIFILNDNLINLDVTRTFPSNKEFIENNGEKKLERVLNVWANYNNGIGYVQGINFIAGYFLIRTNSEELTFWFMNNLLCKDLKDIFKKDLPGLWTLGYQFHKSLDKVLPKLNKFLIENNVNFVAWLTPWILTLLTRYFEPPKLDIFLEMIIEEGLLFLLKFILAIVIIKKKNILSLNSSKIIHYLNPLDNKKKTKSIWTKLNFDDVLQRVKKINLTNRELNSWEVEFNEQLVIHKDYSIVVQNLCEMQMNDYIKSGNKDTIILGTALGIGGVALIGTVIGTIAAVNNQT